MILFYSGNIGDQHIPEEIGYPTIMLTFWEIRYKRGIKKRIETRATRRFHNVVKKRRTK